jgi:spore coat protein U-like protein
MQWGSSWTGNYPLDRQMATSGGAASGDKMFYGVVFGNQTGLPAGTYTVTITGGKLQNYAYSGSPPTCSTSGQASSTSFQLVVSATIAASCTVSSSNVDFGQRGIITQSATTTALVTTSCPSGTNYQIGLNAGTGVGATMSERRMTRSGGSDTLTYRLYRDSGRTQVWGDGTGGSTTVSTTGTGAPQTNTIYAELPVQSAPVGSYADTVTVTVTF